MRYTLEELDRFALRDLLFDAKASERQAEHGPFYPERGITKQSLRGHAATCRRYAERFKDGGAHQFVVNGYREGA